MNQTPPLHLFTGRGIELEYMIVDRRSLDVLGVADELLRAASGGDAYVGDFEHGDITWSNELVTHVVELKTTDPAPALLPLPEAFQREIAEINRRLEPLSGCLMPTAMHPWMDPHRQTRLWPHDNGQVYAAFDRIFDCRGHGWSNLQSVHLNLPFAGDDEFGRLHAAVRLVLPILPALAASSPIVEGRLAPHLDARLEMYRGNCRRIPLVTARVIPEPVFTRAEYEEQILQRMYAEIAPFDPQRLLAHEWLNARGAIPRFDRSTIEIRLLDVQECPLADVAVCAAVEAVVRALSSQRWTPLNEQQRWPVGPLERIFLQTVRDADRAQIDDLDYLRQFGLDADGPMPAGALWRRLLDELSAEQPSAISDTWLALLAEGPLARRIVSAWQRDPSPAGLKTVYGRLCDCLAAGRMFLPTLCGPGAGQPQPRGADGGDAWQDAQFPVG